jgi:hypothetical protein
VRLLTLLVGLILALASAPIALAGDTVTIRMEDEAGTPIAGLSVALWVRIGDADDTIAGMTDADGRVSFVVDLPAGERTYTVEGRKTFVDAIEGCTRTRLVDADDTFVGDLPPDPWIITTTTSTTYDCPAPPDGSPVIHVTYSTPDGAVPDLADASYGERRGDGLTYSSILTPDGDGLTGTVYDWPDATVGILLSMPQVSEPPDEDGCIAFTATTGSATVPLAEALAGPIHVTLDQQAEGSVCGETSAPNAPNAPNAPAITLPPTDSMPGDGFSADRPSPGWLLLVIAAVGIVIGCRQLGHRVRGAAH